METWSLALISLLLLLCAAGLMASHVRAWRRIRRQEPPPEDFDYRRRQYRRRMQTSAMLGLLAVAIFVGQLITSRPSVPWAHWSRLFALGYWGAVLLVVGWVALLALVDMLATKHHFNRLRQTYFVEQAKLHAELRRIQASRGNGKASKKDPDSGPAG